MYVKMPNSLYGNEVGMRVINVVGDFSLKTTVSNHHGYERLWQH